jgi:hypothetical protein
LEVIRSPAFLIFFSYILYGHIEFPTAKGIKSLPSRTAIDPPGQAFGGRDCPWAKAAAANVSLLG